MKHLAIVLIVAAMIALFVCNAFTKLQAAVAWQPSNGEDIKTEMRSLIEARTTDAAVREKTEALWADLPATATEDDLLMRVAQTFALVDPNAAKLVAVCSSPRAETTSPSAEAWLRAKGVPPIEANNLRLLYAEWLVQGSLYDEAREQLAGLQPKDVVAPAALLFYQSVVDHALLDKEASTKAIDSLLHGEAVPRRYAAVARLMQDDLEGLKPDTLDHIARRMDDIRRRLDLGRAGPKVRKEQDGVVKSLDKLIKKLEEEQERQQKQQAGNSSQLRPGNPAKESRIAGGKGPGEVTKKTIGSESGWGNLPPKERQESLQQIGREFPSHYRDAIEQYFRRLAAEEE